VQDFRDLKVWERSRELAFEVYRMTAKFPKEERYGLTSQVRRSCSSIPANIAEGRGWSTNADLVRFLHITMGSACELESHLILAHDLAFTTREDHEALNDELTQLKRMLTGLIRGIRATGQY
jgi:four helix bundle protein